MEYELKIYGCWRLGFEQSFEKFEQIISSLQTDKNKDMREWIYVFRIHYDKSATEYNNYFNLKKIDVFFSFYKRQIKFNKYWY